MRARELSVDTRADTVIVAAFLRKVASQDFFVLCARVSLLLWLIENILYTYARWIIEPLSVEMQNIEDALSD